MSRYIDADKLMKTIREHDYTLVDKYNSFDNGMFTIGIQQAVDEQPTADVEEVKHGKWMPSKHGDYYCSMCGGSSTDSIFNYCPFCGTKLDLE